MRNLKNYPKFIFLLLFLITIVSFLYQIIRKCTDFRSPNRVLNSNTVSKVTIYFITPTYNRPVQEAELTRLSSTLLLMPNVHWILVEDASNRTGLINDLLDRVYKRRIYQFNYTHLYAETPIRFKTRLRDPNWLKPRGVWQRNEALRWIRENVPNNKKGVVYFGDDDNTYDPRLSEELITTEKVSVFPVGLVGGLLVEKPLVQNNKVFGFNSIWKTKRKYPIDMAGFAINLKLIHKFKNVFFSPYVPRGYQETHLLSQVIQSIEDLEPKADQCSKVLVWHTRTENPKIKKNK
ncbi:RNA-binding protein Nova-1 [Sarcoptes scabiei]|nr:RNA-binding protein Nova-1 [Sarcoptes scabiei]